MENLETKGSKNKTPPFGQLPKWILKHNVLHSLTRNDLAVLYVLVIRADNTSALLMIKNEKIALLGSVHKRLVSKSLKNLQWHDIISIKRKGNRNQIKINREPSQFIKETEQNHFSPYARKKRGPIQNQIRNCSGQFEKGQNPNPERMDSDRPT